MGRVCDDGWDLYDAQVVCHEIGYGNPIAANHNACYGQCHHKRWLGDLNCVGTEWIIGNYLHKEWNIHKCRYYEAAGVMCATG